MSGQDLTVNASIQVIGSVTSPNNGRLFLGGAGDNASVGVTVNSGTLVLNKQSSLSVHAVGGSLIANSGTRVQLGNNSGDQLFGGATVTLNAGSTLATAGSRQAPPSASPR